MGVLSILSIVAGIALFSWTFVDLFQTVFMLGGGAGLQSRAVADRMWRGALRLHAPTKDASHSWLRALGPLIVLAALACWVLQLVLAWGLIFVPSAFMDPAEISFNDRMLFAGKAILGRATNSPALKVDADGWEVVLFVAGLTGVIVVSVGLAYVIPLLASVAHKRSSAATIHALGDGPDDMAELGRTRAGSSFELHLVSLIPTLALVAERHRSYPVLHYFHSKDPHAALAPAIAKLAIFLHSDLTEIDKVDATVVKPLKHAIHNLIDAVGMLGLKDFAHNHPDIDSDKLGSLDISPKHPPPNSRLPELEWLRAYVLFDGWDWEAIKVGAPTCFAKLARGSSSVCD